MRSLMKLSILNLIMLACTGTIHTDHNALNCGAFDMRLKAGASPIIWKNLRELSILSCPINPLTITIRIANFATNDPGKMVKAVK